MTPQEIFDKVYLHCMKQGKPALNGTDCMYETKDGLQCAIGCLIEDKDLRLEMNNAGAICEMDEETFKLLPSYFSENFDLLDDLQSAHDSTYILGEPFKEGFYLRAVKIANDHNLSVPEYKDGSS